MSFQRKGAEEEELEEELLEVPPEGGTLCGVGDFGALMLDLRVREESA